MVLLIRLGILLAIGIPTLWVAAKRFERRRITTGDWDSQGPKHPSRQSRYRGFGLLGNGLAFDQTHGIVRPEDHPGDQQPPATDPPPPAT